MNPVQPPASITWARLHSAGREIKIAGSGWARSLVTGGGEPPSFLVIGAQRAGTTSLFKYLATHPDVVPPHSKELQYFSRYYRRGARWYRGGFPRVKPGQQTFEATPLYLFDPRTPRRVYETIPATRLVALLRDPVERAYSQYRHNVKLGLERRSFREAILTEDRRLGLRPDGTMTAGLRAQRRHGYAARGRYAEQLQRWYEWFPREQMLVVRSEDLYAWPAETYATVLRFLGLSAQPGVTFSRYNHWDDPSAELTPDLRAYLEARFAGPNADLARLLGWSRTWEYAESDAGR